MAYLGLPGLELHFLPQQLEKPLIDIDIVTVHSCSPGSFSWHTSMLFATVQLYTIFQGLCWPDQWWLRFCSDHAAISGCLRQKRAGQAVASDQEICRAVSTSNLKQLGLKTHETLTPQPSVLYAKFQNLTSKKSTVSLFHLFISHLKRHVWYSVAAGLAACKKWVHKLAMAWGHGMPWDKMGQWWWMMKYHLVI